MWDDRYSAEHYIYGKTPNDFLRENVTALPKGKILCLGDGEGRNSVFLARQGYDLTALDASRVGQDKARRLAEEQQVSITFIHSDINDYTIEENAWDGIVSIFFHLLEPERRRLHRQVIAGLKQGGVLLLEAYTPRQLMFGDGGPSTEDLMMTPECLAQELESLHFHHLQELERDVTEGTHHAGTGAVVQAIASKP